MKTFPALRDNDLILLPLVHQHIQTIRAWRNRDDVRPWLFDSHVITEQEQERWWENVYAPDPNDCIWTAYLVNRLFGMASLYHIDLDKREGEWGRLIIGEDWARGKGLGKRIGVLVREYGFDLGLERLYCSLYTANTAVTPVDLGIGFRPYKVEGDVTYMELWRKDWR